MTIIRDVAKFKSLLDLFPLREQISYCFAYGSAVFEQALNPTKQQHESTSIETLNSSIHTECKKQIVAGKSGNGDDRKMIDLVLAIDDPFEWHQANLQVNKSHYSGLRFLGPRWITKIQQHFGAKIFYNTLIPVGNRYIKYGVISTKDLVNDLLDWDTFYISGRLHKPTLTLAQNAVNFELNNALKINQQSAVHAALLLLPERFTEQQLYLTIAGLSYAGDFRMTFGEDRHKVAKIVTPQMAAFRALYQPLLVSDLLKDLVHWKHAQDELVQNCSIPAIQWHLQLLPKTVQYYLSKEWLAANVVSSRLRLTASAMDMDDLMRRLAFDITYRDYLKRAIQSIVFKSSWSQSLKGVFTAGLGKSITYSADKINKMLKSEKKQPKQHHLPKHQNSVNNKTNID